MFVYNRLGISFHYLKQWGLIINDVWDDFIVINNAKRSIGRKFVSMEKLRRDDRQTTSNKNTGCSKLLTPPH